MYLMDKQQFLAMPPETIFSRFYPDLMKQHARSHDMQPVAFGDLYIKGETRDGDFDYSELVDGCAAGDDGHGKLGKSLMAGIATINHYRAKFQVFTSRKSGNRPGVELAPPEELYAVWEDHDVRSLVMRLQRATQVTRQPMLLSSVDELVASWISVEDSAATS